MAYTESYVQLAADGPGKKVRTFQNSISGNTVEHEGFVVCDANGKVVGVRQYGPLRTSSEEKFLFLDTHDQALDLVNRWAAATGANLPAVSSSVLTFGTATTASAFGKLVSNPTFGPLIPAFCQNSFAIKLDATGAAATGGHRFWGLGTSPATPATTSAATKLTDAIGFEVDTDGKMYAVVYANGTRSSAIDLSASGTGDAQSKQPLDGGYHRYLIQIRTDRIYWFIDGLDTPVASVSFITPTTQTLPILLQTINPATSVAAGGYPLLVQGTVVADTAGNHNQLADGTYPWRKATVSSAGRLQVEATPTSESYFSGTLTAAQPVITTPVAGGTLTVNVPDGSQQWNFWITSGITNGSTQIEFEGFDGTTWRAITGVARNTTTPFSGTNVTGAQAAGFGLTQFIGDIAGHSAFRVRMSVKNGTDAPVVNIKITSAGSTAVQVQPQIIIGNANEGAAPGVSPVQVGGTDGSFIRALRITAKATQATLGLATQDLKDSGRTPRVLRMDIPVLTTATDALMSLTEYNGSAVGATTTPAVVTAGKRLRIQTVMCTYVATATAGLAKFTLRANSGGVVAIGSAAIVTHVVGAGTPGTAGSSQSEAIPIPDGLEFVAGTGIGISMVGLGVTMAAAVAGYGKCTIYGYEY
jgi:hypothetical protein